MKTILRDTVLKITELGNLFLRTKKKKYNTVYISNKNFLNKTKLTIMNIPLFWYKNYDN